MVGTLSTQNLVNQARQAREASKRLARASTEAKNKALASVAHMLVARQAEVLEANGQDCSLARAQGLDAAMIDRLLLNEERLAAMAADVRAVAALPDPVGEVFDMRTLPNGLQVGKRRVPLGVIGVIYESRPNVTIDISVLCLKSGNAVVLRGGREAINSNRALVAIVKDACAQASLTGDAVQFIDNPDRALVGELLKMREYIDLMVPRGGAELVRFVSDNATMPVVTGGIGVCHTFVDADADLVKAVSIAYNAKVRRPTICNALDTVLVHNGIAARFLPALAREWAKAGVELHCDERAMAQLNGSGSAAVIKEATEEDWGKEFLSLTAAVKVVDSLDEALEHIDRYGSGHSEAIITEDYSSAMRFLAEVDAAAVYVNASTQFTDGGQFGLGAEVGISTQKFHARGPMGLKEMTSYKWIIMGQGQTRP
ncbi:MAG: glutamate-5-semialdehyde dehydrogenase [Dehalococcoidia bacterium]|nr:glutamate-5-semialdehyde dehydrogenase [Dehalococcoidia bacterium]